MGPGGLRGPVEGMQEVRGVQLELIRAAGVSIYGARIGFQQLERKSFLSYADQWDFTGLFKTLVTESCHLGQQRAH